MSYEWKLSVKPPARKGYDPDQPREPKGSPEGGQWMDAGTVAPLGKPATLKQIDPFDARPIVDAPSHLMTAARKVVESVARVTKADLSQSVVTLLDEPFGDTLGLSCKIPKGPQRGTRVVAVSLANIREALKRTGFRALTPDWLGLPSGMTLNEQTVMEHTIAHELGHKAWNTLSAEAQGGWQAFFKQNEKGMSGYARYYHDEREGFADAFANFALGYDQPFATDEWLMEKL